MTKGRIWWTRVSSSVELLQEIKDRLRYQESFVLTMPLQIPWEAEFVQVMQSELAQLDAVRTVRILQEDSTQLPEDLVLDQLCPSEVRDNYWPGQSKTEYIATSDIPRLAQYNVWVRGITNPTRLAKWQKFVRLYEKHRGNDPQHAAFLLESAETCAQQNEKQVEYHVKECDCYAFCLELAGKLSLAPFLQRYAAELSRALARENPQVCEALFLQNELLIIDPSTAVEYAQTHCPQFQMQAQALYITLWKIQLMFCFPLLESFRLDFVAKHVIALDAQLPVTSSNGEMIEQAKDLELGTLYFLCNKNKMITDKDTFSTLAFCRELRNLLAHGEVLTYPQIVQLLSEVPE